MINHANDLSYDFTINRESLKQYFKLRKQIYAKELGITIPEKDEFDLISHICIVKKKHFVIGGARITICEPTSMNILPMEENDFMLKDILPHLSLHNVVYAEYSKLALLPSYRNAEISKNLYEKLNQKSLQLGVRYIFAITPLSQARRYSLTYTQLGYTSHILKNIDIPERIMKKYHDLAECISMVDLMEHS